MKSYAIEVEGEGRSSISAAVPEDIENLLGRPKPDEQALLFQIIKTQIELLCQKGDTAGAIEVFEKFKLEQQQRDGEYRAPLNVFKRDHQNGGYPYLGAHCIYGAFRDAAGDLFQIYYKKKGDLQQGKASDKHLRKSIRVIPNHIFFYRNGKSIVKPDEKEGQQPTEGTPGFARYEVIHVPWRFSFTMQIIIAGPFSKFLEDSKNVVEAIKASRFFGLGSRRSANYGQWDIVKLKVKDWNFTL